MSIQPGEIFKTSESTSPGAAPLIDIGVTALSPLISGHTVSATVSTPGVARRRSITWLQNTGGWGRWVVVSRLRMRSAENPVGWFESRSNDVTNSPATKWTTKQKAICAAISACISRRRECGSSPPLSALTGLTAEARSAGSMPNRNVTPSASASAKPSTRQSAGSARRAGSFGGLIIPRIYGADHHANSAPRDVARKASQALSTRISCTKRHRPAPIDTRSAISRARAAACAVIRFATLALAISSTSITRMPSAMSDTR